jgi:hypothetical protein
MKTGLLYLMACSFAAGWYCANNDVAGELTALYDGLIDYTAARAARARRVAELEAAGQLQEAEATAGGAM